MKGLQCLIILCALLVHVAYARVEAAVSEVMLDGDVEEIIAEEDETMKPVGKSEEEADDLVIEDVDEPGDKCIRYSPKEVFYSHLNPRLLRILDELSHFVESVMSRIESSLQTLLPFVIQSPIGRMRVEEVFPEVRAFMMGTMRDVYDEIGATWKDLIHAHAHRLATPSHTLTLLAHIRETQQQGEQRLVISLQEFSVTLKAIIYNSIQVVQSSLKLPSEADNLSADLVINSRIFKMYTSLETLIEKDGWDQVMESFWRSTIIAAQNYTKESPIHDVNFEVIFQNEEYLAELVLQLMASF
ncbi:uncharacterized protein [Procambarus clarkii]|uniref:uncharacterized protein isoform X6 n=1 Tax=Procambarus clarkii TaxID=6728 RepID=UPI001E672356|nr:uncharacterized protein LOC123767304 isoform X3 [Procambarus clarkii]